MLRREFLAGLVLAACLGGGADACPVCRSETGRQVRAGIFGKDFGPNLAAVLLPFSVVLGVAAALHFGCRPSESDARSGPSSGTN